MKVKKSNKRELLMAEQEAAKKLEAFKLAEKERKRKAVEDEMDRLLEEDEEEEEVSRSHSLRVYHPKSRHLV